MSSLPCASHYRAPMYWEGKTARKFLFISINVANAWRSCWSLILSVLVRKFSLFLSRSIVCDVRIHLTNIATRLSFHECQKKASLWIHSIIVTQCTYSAFFITQIQMLYITVTSVTQCDQYRVSTSLNTDRQTYLCCALHTYNWRYWYYRDVKSHYGIDVIVLWKVDVSVTISLPCATYGRKLRWAHKKYNSNSASSQVSIIFSNCLTF